MIKFTECLNDTWDYFFLTDPASLLRFKQENSLSDDLIHEFTTNESGELATQQGIIIPMCNISNQPYTIFFNTNNQTSVFKKETSLLLFERTGYMLEITNNEICLITVPYLKNWTVDNGIYRLNEAVKVGSRQRITLENGWYTVGILGGFTVEENIEEATFEFQINRVSTKAESKVTDIGFSYLIEK
ncbi:hypothetical protein HN014_03715 [Aquimarina sp. TRL1]|uniref:hypothetical protein n=1 Tax=Aquimarina sp. (strain TRL1) TaxID=2736252 RepID=UPI00158C69C4|nr:hypothetical protein [Aquimarina sp. TRL1]QKX04048.1 hypothetical protein HN014_03715 [Aquimarina sp. TRL1]